MLKLKKVNNTINNWLILFVVLATVQLCDAQNFTRRNSPYSRYGLGDMFSTQFQPTMSTGGGLAASYHSLWDANLANPASLAHLRFTAFETGAFYKYSGLNEPSTGLSTSAHDGNLSYLSLAFPITRSWQIETDTLRRGVPIQWGMGVSLLPHSTVAYDVRVTRNVEDVGDVLYQYEGEGSRFRVNWGNGIRYKGFAIGANLGFLFGTVNNNNLQAFQDSSYTYGFSNQVQYEENSTGLLWDIGAQYDLYLKKEKEEPNVLDDLKLTAGLNLSGSSKIRIYAKEEAIRFGTFYGTDTVFNTGDTLGSMNMPLKVSAGINLAKGINWRVGVNYEAELWSQFKHSLRDVSVANSYQLGIGGEYTPNYKDFKHYFNRVKYRFGAYFGTDPRMIGDGVDNKQLQKYGITFGLGLPVKPLKSTILGHVHLGFEYGFLGHPDLIRENFFQVNLAFSLNDQAWFVRSKFR